jgi:hypothetical protein
MVEIPGGNIPYQPSSSHYQARGDQTEGYSSRDIAIVDRDALMQPFERS